MIHPRSLLLAARLPGLVFGLLALLALLVGPVLALAPTEAATWADFSPGGGAWIGTLPATAAVTVSDGDGLTATAVYRLSTDGGLTWSTWSNANLTVETLDANRRRLTVAALALAEGANFIQFRIEDGGGDNERSPAYLLNVDTQPPSSPLTPAPQPPGWTNLNSFGAVWTNPSDLSGIGGAWYKLDTAPTAANDGIFVAGDGLSSLSGVSVAGDGSHTLWFWLADKLGHTDQASAVSVTLLYDATPPAALTNAAIAPAGWTNINSFDLDWSLPIDPSGIGGVRYKLDAPPLHPADGAFWPGAIGSFDDFTIPGGVEGEHNLYLWPVDGAGNAALTAVAVSLRLDTTPPPAPLAVPVVLPGGWQTSATATFTATWQNPADLSGIAAACYKLGTAPLHNADGVCVTGAGIQQITGIAPPAPGTYHFFLWLQDTAGNRNKDHRGVALDAIRWDAVAPEIFIDATGPSGANGWYRGAVNITLIATDVGSGLAGVQYSLDGGAWQTGSQAQIGSEGNHTLIARATDVAGNVRQTAPAPFPVDSQAPQTVIALNRTPGYQTWYDGPVTAVFTPTDVVSGPDYVEWQLDGGAWQRQATAQVSAEGPHTLSYRSADLAGNVEPVRTRVVGIDLAPPVTSYALLPTGTTGGWYTQPVSITLVPADDGAGVAATHYRVDGSDWMTGTTFIVAENGEHVVEFYSVDHLGQAETPYRIPGGIRIDREAPRAPVPLDTQPRGWTNRNSFALTLAVPPDLSGIAGAYVKVGAPPLSTSDGVWRPGGGSILTDVHTPAEGRYTAYVWLKDVAGNTDIGRRGIWDAELSLAYDATPPHTEAELEGAAGERGWFTSPVRVSLVATDTLAGVVQTQVSIDGAVPVTTTTFTLSSADKHTLLFHSDDAAGNVEDSQLVTVRIDPDAPPSPQGVSTSPQGWAQTNSFSLTWTNPPDTSGIAIGYYKIGDPPTHLKDGIAVPPTGTARGITVPGEGAWDIHFWLVDQAGNGDPSRRVTRASALRYDGSPPTTAANVIQGALGQHGWYTTNVIVQLTATDLASGVAQVRWRIDGGPWQNAGATSQVIVAGLGQHLLEYQALDAANNIESLRQLPIKIDSAPPHPAFLPVTRYQRQISFDLNWYGADQPTGSGLDGFELQSKDGRNSAWTAWGAVNVPDVTGRFFGNLGHRYFFRLRAYDLAGNRSGWVELPWGVYIDTVANGDFAGGWGAWQPGGNMMQSVTAEPPPAGGVGQVIQLGSPDYGPNVPGLDILPGDPGDVPIGDGHVRQLIRIPGADTLDYPTLTLWYRIFTYDTKYSENHQKWFDTLDVRLFNAGGEWLALRDGLPVSQWQEGQLADLGWRYLSIDIPPAWRGTTATLSIENWNRNDGRLNTWSYVADVRVWEPYRLHLPLLQQATSSLAASLAVPAGPVPAPDPTALR